MWGVRFPEGLRLKIDDFAARHSIPRAEAIRRLVQDGLERNAREE